MCKAYGGGADVPKALHNPITHLGSWKGSFFFIENKIIPSDYPELLLGKNKCFVEMDFRSFMLGGVDGELNFLPAEVASEGRNSPSTKYNVADSDDPSYGEDEQTLIGPSLSPHPEASKKFKILGKRKIAFGAPGKALPPKVQKTVIGLLRMLLLHLGNNILAKISIEHLCDIHDRAYMRQAILDILDKDMAYAELERKCNEALRDLDKNPLVSNMRAKIKDLQGQVDGLHSIESERERLKSVEIKLLQEIDSLKQDRDVVVSKFVPDIAIKLIRSDDLGVLIAKLVRICQASDALANASYPFLAEYVANSYASLEQLLSKKPPLLRPTFSRSHSKPLSPKVK
ncbi:hypothetical protein Tco_1257624 [Tanacetum coccineum]